MSFFSIAASIKASYLLDEVESLALLFLLLYLGQLAAHDVVLLGQLLDLLRLLRHSDLVQVQLQIICISFGYPLPEPGLFSC